MGVRAPTTSAAKPNPILWQVPKVPEFSLSTVGLREQVSSAGVVGAELSGVLVLLLTTQPQAGKRTFRSFSFLTCKMSVIVPCGLL